MTHEDSPRVGDRGLFMTSAYGDVAFTVTKVKEDICHVIYHYSMEDVRSVYCWTEQNNFHTIVSNERESNDA